MSGVPSGTAPTCVPGNHAVFPAHDFHDRKDQKVNAACDFKIRRRNAQDV